MSEFPPWPHRAHEVALLVEAFASVVDDSSAIYVSSPLTTGSRAFEWHRQNPNRGPTAFVTDVIEPNRRDAAEFVRLLRERTSRPVIDPTALRDLEGWQQQDYRYFWGRVIELYCYEIIFRDGWHYSSGCSYEFLIAVQTGLATYSEQYEPLVVSEALGLLDAAVAETRARGASATFLSSVRDTLREKQVVS